MTPEEQAEATRIARLTLRRNYWAALGDLGTKLYADLRATGLSSDDALGWVKNALVYEAERLDFGVPPAWARTDDDATAAPS